MSGKTDHVKPERKPLTVLSHLL